MANRAFLVILDNIFLIKILLTIIKRWGMHSNDIPLSKALSFFNEVAFDWGFLSIDSLRSCLDFLFPYESESNPYERVGNALGNNP